MTGSLPLPFYLFALGLLAFGVIVVIRWLTHLTRQARDLARRANVAASRLEAAAEEVSIEAGKAARARERIEDRRARSRGRRV